ncbi:TPA: hypothetical protein ACVOYJ_002911, partial [Vibrio diabolicus]
ECWCSSQTLALGYSTPSNFIAMFRKKYMENLLRVIFPDAVQSNVLIGWGKNENQNNNVVSTRFIVCQCQRQYE